MNRRQRQIGENEAIFRSVNEQIQSLNSTLTTVTDTMRIVCECGNRSCTDQFAIMPADYARVREDPTLFLTRPARPRLPRDRESRREGRELLGRAQGSGPA